MFEDHDSTYHRYASFDPQRDPNSFIFKSKVNDLGLLNLPLNQSTVPTDEAVFGMG